MNIVMVFLLGFSLAAPSFCGGKDAYNHFAKALLLERSGDMKSAMEEYQKTLLLDPDAFFVYKQAINLAFKTGDMGSVGKWSAYLVEKDSSSAESWVLRGNFFWLKGDNKKAVDCFSTALEIDPENKEAVYQLAGIYSMSDVAKSIDYFEKYVKLDPENKADAYYKIASLLSINGKYEQMEKYLEKAVKEDKYYLPPRYMLAEYYELKKDTAAAINQYSRIFRLNPRDFKVSNQLAEYYLSAGNLSRAREYFLKTLEIDGSNPTACYWLAMISEKDGDFASAVKYLEASKDIESDPRKILQLSYYYTQDDKYSTAVKMLEDAFKKWPKNGEIGYFLALGHLDMGEREKAFETLRKASRFSPENVEILTQLGIVAESLDKVKAMEESFKKVLKINPGNDVVLNYLGYSLADRGLKLEEAKKYIERALEISPKNAAYADSLGWVYFKLGEKKKALKEIIRAVRLFEKSFTGEALQAKYDSTVLEHLGDVYWSMEEYSKAWRSWEAAFLAAGGKKEELGKKAEDAFEKMEEAGGVFRAFFSGLYSALEQFSSLAKLEIKIGPKRITLDALVNYERKKGLAVDFLGPMFTPVCRAQYSPSGFKMDEFEFEGDISFENIKYWTGIFMEAMRDFYEGEIFSGAGEGKNALKGRCVETAKYKACFDKSMAKTKKIFPLKEKDAGIYFGEFLHGTVPGLPGEIEFKAPFSEVRLKFSEPKIKIPDFKFDLPDE